MNYRREIDGLRALAILPVIFFHAGFQTFSGGFVGVDIFFVISGYLITSIILAERQQGTFTLAGFYERRARRILPALFVVMFACLPLAWMWLMPSDLMSFSQSMMAVSVFASNMFFWKMNGYFDTAAELKPLLHTWSLAVEEQYYLLFPIFLLLVWRTGKRWMVGALAIAAVVSLGIAQWGVLNKPAAAFYLLPTRGWELMIGALIAYYYFTENRNETPAVETGSAIDQSMSLFGLLLIAYAVFAFDKSTPVPGPYALIPTLGAAFIILYASPQTFTGKLLGSKLLVGVGLISYSAYLWHQPLFAFARYRNISELSAAWLLLLSLLALALAFISWKYVEKPFRDRSRFGRKQIFILSLVGSALFMGFGLAGHLNKGFEMRMNLPPQLAESLARSNLRAACDKDYDGEGKNIGFCMFGDMSKAANPQIAVFGDSHAEAILPAFDEIGKRLGEGVVHIGLPICPPLLGVHTLKGYFDFGVCNDLAKRQLDYVKSRNIKKVFLVSRWAGYTDGGYAGGDLVYLGFDRNDKLDKHLSRQAFEAGLSQTIKAYRDAGAEVYVVAQIPQQLQVTKNVYYSMYSRGLSGKKEIIRDSSVPLIKHNNFQFYTRSLFRKHESAGEIKLVVLDSLFCDDTRCVFGNEEQAYLYDEDHLSNTGARLLVDEILKSTALQGRQKNAL